MPCSTRRPTFGAEFDADLLAAAHGAPLLAVLESLEAAEAAGLVQPHPARPAGFAFVHALFRSHRYRALPLRRRLELHARAAAALATRPDDERLLAERARHACLAVPVGDADVAVDLARQAAAPRRAGLRLRRGRRPLPAGARRGALLDPPEPATVLDLTSASAPRSTTAATRRACRCCSTRRAGRGEHGDTDALVRAATAIPQFGAVGFVDPMPEGRAVTEAALAALGDEPTPGARPLLVDLASHWLFVDVDEALELAAGPRRSPAISTIPTCSAPCCSAARHLSAIPAASTTGCASAPSSSGSAASSTGWR